MSEQNVTRLLAEWRQGDEQAFEELLPVVYEELRRLASFQMRGERQNHTLQPTALVNEAVLRLVGIEVDWTDKAHFMAVVSRQMRRLLVDHARAKRRHKRDGGLQVTLEDSVAETAVAFDLIDVDLAIESLKDLDARKAELVELHYFAGLTYRELAEVVGLSEATVHRELRVAKAWLRRELGSPASSD